MAVNFSVNHTRSSEYRLLPEDITIRPELNGRCDTPDIEWLIADILKIGQTTPVTIRNDGGKPVLVAGYSRWRACTEINLRGLAPVKMQLRCTYVQCTEAEAFKINLSENRFRNSTTELDDACNLHTLTARYAMTEEQAAKVYFPTAMEPDAIATAVKWVKKRLKLYDLVPEAQEAVKDGRIKGGAALAIAKLSEAQQREVVKHDGPITAKDVPSSKPKKPSKLRSLADTVRLVLDDDEYESQQEYITVPLPQLKALLEAIR